MPRPCDAEGHYRARIVDFGIKEFKSGAVSISLKAELLARLEETDDGAEYLDIERIEMEASGDVCIVKKDGALNDAAVQSLVNHAGWDGDLTSIMQRTWHPLLCSITVKSNEYKGNVQYQIAFVNAWDWMPRGMSNVSKQRAAELQEKYGPTLRMFQPASRPAPPIQRGEAWEPPTMPTYRPDSEIPF